MRMPSLSELNTIYQNRATITGLSGGAYYWSVTKYSSDVAWGQDFGHGGQHGGTKDYVGNVRCVR